LEFDLVSDRRLNEIIFTPKYLSIGPGEENSVTIRAISQFEERESNRAILKYKIRGTRLSQCLVFELGQL